MLRCLPAVLVLLLALVVSAAAPAPAAAKDDEHAAAKEGGQKKAEPNILEPRLDLTIWTVIVFGLLLLVLRKWAWGPMLEGLQGRESRIRGALDEANMARDEAQKLRDQFQTEMDNVHGKIRELMDEARRDGQQTKDRLVAEAKAEIQQERDRTRREMERERDQAVQELWNQTAQLATLVSAKAIGRSLDDNDQRRLVDQAVAELRNAPTTTA
jgi:F-type H+-transporting ATPase subunit b